jgi:hypothetical protein
MPSSRRLASNSSSPPPKASSLEMFFSIVAFAVTTTDRTSSSVLCSLSAHSRRAPSKSAACETASSVSSQAPERTCALMSSSACAVSSPRVATTQQCGIELVELSPRLRHQVARSSQRSTRRHDSQRSSQQHSPCQKIMAAVSAQSGNSRPRLRMSSSDSILNRPRESIPHLIEPS